MEVSALILNLNFSQAVILRQALLLYRQCPKNGNRPDEKEILDAIDAYLIVCAAVSTS